MEEEETHTEIVCRNCKHRIRYHCSGQFGCVVKDCNCKEMEPIEVEVKDKEQHDIIHTKKGKIIAF